MLNHMNRKLLVLLILHFFLMTGPGAAAFAEVIQDIVKAEPTRGPALATDTQSPADTDPVLLQNASREKVTGDLKILLQCFENGVIDEAGAQVTCIVYCDTVTVELEKKLLDRALAVQSVDPLQKKIVVRVLLEKILSIAVLSEVRLLTQ